MYPFSVATSNTGDKVLPNVKFEARLSSEQPLGKGDTVRTSDELKLHYWLESDSKIYFVLYLSLHKTCYDIVAFSTSRI